MNIQIRKFYEVDGMIEGGSRSQFPASVGKGESDWVEITDSPLNIGTGYYWIYLSDRDRVLLASRRGDHFYYLADNLVLGNITHYKPCLPPAPPTIINTNQ